MATVTQPVKTSTIEEPPPFELDVPGWLKSHVLNNPWKIAAAVLLVAINLLLIRSTYMAAPVRLSSMFTTNGEPTGLGQAILAVTAGPTLTLTIVVLWLVGGLLVVYSAGRRRWPGPVRWLKDSLYTGFFGALVTLALVLILVFAARGALAWTVFGAEFSSDPAYVATVRPATPGAIWGIVRANARLFAVGQYPSAAIWRVWASLGLILLLSILTILAWRLGSPLRRLRTALVWAWLASLVVIYLFLGGLPNTTTGPFQEADTNRWGGFLLTMVIAVFGIVISFPIGVLLALGRRSQVRGVPLLWLWGAIGLVLYWAYAGFPSESVRLTIPVLFRDPPMWAITLPPAVYAAMQALVVVGTCWIIASFLQGNLIKTFSIAYIELIRGVPLITILFMANIMLPIFLPRGFEVDNVVRVTIGIILFSAAYLAENVRGGLQAIPRGQYEAAAAIGLSSAQAMRLVILPQALRAVIPANVGQFITLFKDTSLVAIVGLLDLLRIAQVVVAQPEWLGLQVETYTFVALVYWVFSYAMSAASQELERKLGVGQY